MPTSRVAGAAVLLLGVLLAGCGDDGVQRVTAYADSTRPVLLVAPPTDAGDAAVVAGVLDVNDAGCFTVGDRHGTFVLLAPDGSTVVADGTGVDIPGIGEVGIGEEIETGGGYLEDDAALREYADCLGERDDGVVVLAPSS